MDEKRSNAVSEAFVRLHKQGLLYRYAWHRRVLGKHFFVYYVFSSTELDANLNFLDKYNVKDSC